MKKRAEQAWQSRLLQVRGGVKYSARTLNGQGKYNVYAGQQYGFTQDSVMTEVEGGMAV